MDVQKKLDEIVATVTAARSMPMSASCVINRAELLALLEELRAGLPGALARAQEVVGDREQLVAEAREEAERIIESARAHRGSLISDTEVARQSQEEADRILAEARRQAEEVRTEADDYVDSKLANFEVVLTKTIGSVDRGREKLLGRTEEGGGQGDPGGDAPEPSSDPRVQRQQADAYVDAKLGAVSAVLSKTLEAVGRGREKLLGARPADELGAHMAAQDGLRTAHPTSDADFLAGLAAPQAPAAPEPAAAAHGAPHAAPHAGGYEGYYEPQAYQPDPYTYQQQYGTDSGSHGHQPDPYAVQSGYQQADPYAWPAHSPNDGYGAAQGAYAPQQHQPAAGPPHAGGALDETSLFDTSMIDLEQLRRYEQGR
ncbi:ATP synthase F0 subunit B [Streptomyces roseoverticillatus]|uniref:ATP synthase F0 subunit B n=1 Tax=Streptomyces roseoverticillatus TaxID=66429 RepID=UPI0004C183BF|nr:ATP synthase F0 subunit B [Streptomyces roseoverticillatus]